MDRVQHRFNNGGKNEVQIQKRGGVPQSSPLFFPFQKNVMHKAKVHKGRALVLGSWNVRTLLDGGNRPERRTALVAMELRRFGIDIAALSETRFAGCGSLREDTSGYTFYWSGLPEDQRRQRGVGFAVSDRINKQIVNPPTIYSERLIKIRLILNKKQHATLLSVYAPTMDSSEEEKNTFYGSLEKAIQMTPRADRLFILGDFNARVGKDADLWPGVLGRFGIGKTNTNGDRLLHLCATQSLHITNTNFNLPEKSIATWTHPRSGHEHLLDYVIVRQRDAGEVCITKAMRGADCNTDHNLLRSKIRLTFRPQRLQQSHSLLRRFNIQKLRDPSINSQFKQKVSDAISNDITDLSVNATWESLKSILSTVSAEVLDFEKRRIPDWFQENSDAISRLVNQKTVCLTDALQDPENKNKKKNLQLAQRFLTTRLRDIKNTWWKEQSMRLQQFADIRSHKEFFSGLKAIYGPVMGKNHTVLNPQNGQQVSQPGEVMQIWKEHFNQLLNQRTPIDWSIINTMEQVTPKVSMDARPVMEELQKAIKQLGNGKSPGADGLPAEIFKNGGYILQIALLKLVHKIWDEECVPEDFKSSTVIPLFKGKGDKKAVDNYRGISLLTCAGKLLARILVNRLNAEILENVTPEEQCGFRESRSTIDLIFVARQIQERCREQRTPLYALFVDFKKAFDSVNREALWTVLGKFGCPGKFINIIKALYTGSTARVQSGGLTSEEFNIFTGVKQGCVLAPTLFSIYLTAIVKMAFDRNDEGIQFDYRLDGRLLNRSRFNAKSLVQRTAVKMLMFADDCALLATSEVELQRLTTAFASTAAKFGLVINIAKTFSLFQPTSESQQPLPNIKIGQRAINNCSEFCYLGSTLTDDLSIDKELRQRVAKAATAFGRLDRRVWSSHDLKIATKLLVYKSMVLSALLYGCETWTVYRKHVRYLDRFHQNCLRRILGIKWQDRVPDTEVLRRASSTGMETTLMHHRLRWTGHVVRMDHTRLPKRLFYGQLADSKRPRCKPKRRFQDLIKDDLKKTSICLETWEAQAANRDLWRSALHRNLRKLEEHQLKKQEYKRDVRKRLLSASVAGDVTPLWCEVCNRACKGRVGLVAHQRTHSQSLAKRARIS